MKLPDNLIKELISEIIGEDAVSLIMLIKEKENVSELKIAEKLGITVNEVRNILYRLNEKDLVSSNRKKDNTKGWYIYFWTFNMNKAKNLLMDYKKEKINKLNIMLIQEQSTNFFKCPNNCTRLSNEQALEYEFKCPECNTLLQQEDKTKRVENIKNEIKKLENDVNELVKLEAVPVKIKKKEQIKEKEKEKEKKKVKKIKKLIKKPKKINKVKSKIKQVIKLPPPRPTKEKLSILKRVKRKLFKR